jgi:hypothetical protein
LPTIELGNWFAAASAAFSLPPTIAVTMNLIGAGVAA